tara:strand:+ start:13 stop:129 length:117 start_codon:yes stop_codon:yes gene_type:complete
MIWSRRRKKLIQREAINARNYLNKIVFINSAVNFEGFK